MVKEEPELRHVQSLFLSLQMACKTISNLVNRAGLVYGVDHSDAFVQEWKKQQQQTEVNAGELEQTTSNNTTTANTATYPNDGRFYSMKRLDQLSTNVLRNALRFTGKVHMVTPTTSRKSEKPAEHQPGVLIASALDSDYVAVLDPMDGSGNADASICTGTVFGIFEATNNDDDENEENQQRLVESVLQPAKNMRAAGYCLYSSATVLVFTFGNDVMGFTLDPQLNEFVLTHPKLTIPVRGNVYSCNEANSEGWSESFQSYLKALKTGKNRGNTRYAHRYVGSMVGDIHRTLLYGGIFCYPSDNLSHPRGNLQLLYKSAPMAFLVTCAGGRSFDGETGDLLHVTPKRVHQKFPCFMGSPQDVDELESYIMAKEKPNRADSK